MTEPSCGLWPLRRGNLMAADPDGFLLFAAALPEDDNEQKLWLSRTQAFVSPGLQLVLPVALARSHPFARYALDCGFLLWLAPAHLTEPLARAAWARPGPRLLAAMLARLPRVPSLRSALRLAPRRPGPRQLRLL